MVVLRHAVRTFAHLQYCKVFLFVLFVCLFFVSFSFFFFLDFTLSPTVVAAIPGGIIQLRSISFLVVNSNAGAVSARYRVRFFNPDGPGGTAGTPIIGISFGLISYPSGQSLFVSGDFSSFTIVLPSTVWVLVFFDNSGATTTAAQLNSLGLSLRVPVVGSEGPVGLRTSFCGTCLSANPVLFSSPARPPSSLFAFNMQFRSPDSVCVGCTDQNSAGPTCIVPSQQSPNIYGTGGGVCTYSTCIGCINTVVGGCVSCGTE